MKELERKRIVEKIKEDIESLQILEKHRKKQEELEKDPIIAQYYDLLSEIKRLEQKTKLFTSLDQTIFWEFTWANINGRDDCSHEIWIYEGSYYCLADPCGDCQKVSRIIHQLYNSYDIINMVMLWKIKIL